MGISIVTDSTSDIPKNLVDKYGINVLPLTVRFGSEEYRDGVDISSEEFYSRLSHSTSLPTTSQVTPSSFIELYKNELNKGNSVISIHISSDLSGTCQSAEFAKKTLNNDRISVIDSRTATIPLGMIVLKAVELVNNGLSHDEVVQKVEEYKKRVRILVVVDTLKYLKKGGRLTRTQALIGDMLNIKPLLTIENGKVVLIDKARGQKKAISKIIEIMEKQMVNVPHLYVGVGNALCRDTAEVIKEVIKNRFSDVEFYDTNVGSVIATHAGPGAFGVAFIEK